MAEAFHDNGTGNEKQKIGREYAFAALYVRYIRLSVKRSCSSAAILASLLSNNSIVA